MSISDKCRSLKFVVPTLGMLVTGAKADVVYSYTGNDFSNTPPSEYFGVYGNVDHVTGSITLSTALPANAVDVFVIPEAFSFTDGVQTLTPANAVSASTNPPGDTTFFEFYTDSTGAVTAWELIVYSSSVAGAWVETGCGPGFLCADAGRLDGNNGGSLYNTPGTWESAVVPSSTPVPAALPLFITGLGAIGLLVWRRNKQTAIAVA